MLSQNEYKLCKACDGFLNSPFRVLLRAKYKFIVLRIRLIIRWRGVLHAVILCEHFPKGAPAVWYQWHAMMQPKTCLTK